MQTIEEKIHTLSPEFQKEVERIVEQMLQRQQTEPRGQWKFDWEGTLSDTNDTFTSVELQHTISNMWRQNVSR